MSRHNDDTVEGQRDVAERIERLLARPCWVVDLLPRRVPEDGGGQFFEVEPVLLRTRQARRRFADVLLGLNCYCDVVVVCGEDDEGVANPSPAWLERQVLGNDVGLSVLLPAEDALVVVPTDSTYLALHNPDEALLALVRQLASTAGLFVWRAEST